MALKLLKINIMLDVKGDVNDQDDLRDRVYDSLQIAMENDDLSFEVLDEEEELDLEE